MVELMRPPDPLGSPLEKLVETLPQSELSRLTSHLRRNNVPEELIGPISSGLSDWLKERDQDIISYLRRVTTWANIHTHAGLGSDGGGGAIPGPFFSYTTQSNKVHRVDTAGNDLLFATCGGIVSNVIVDQTRHVYTIELTTDKVRKWSPEGVQEWEYTLPTAVSGSLSDGLSVDTDGNVYVASGNDVLKLDSEGTLLWTFTGHTALVLSVAVGFEGFVYSTSSDNTVRKISASGAPVWTFAAFTSTTRGLSVGPGNDVWVGGSDSTVRRISSGGVEIWSFDISPSNRGMSIGVNPEGIAIASCLFTGGVPETRVFGINPDGSQRWVHSPGHGVRGAAIDPEGYTYYGVSDTGNRALIKVDPAGTTVWEAGSAWTEVLNEASVEPGTYGGGHWF